MESLLRFGECYASGLLDVSGQKKGASWSERSGAGPGSGDFIVAESIACQPLRDDDDTATFGLKTQANDELRRGAYRADLSPARSRGARATNANRPSRPITAMWRNASPQATGDMPPARSRIQPITMGPTKPPAYPAIECRARVAPRRAGSALPAAPAVREEESSQISTPYTRTRAAASGYDRDPRNPMPAAMTADDSMARRTSR